jgi:uncharacterized protein (DUF1501 family)
MVLRPDRRSFLTSVMSSASLTLLSPVSTWAVDAIARRRLLVVMLKGGMDGLTAVPPYGDPLHATLRPSIHVKKPLPLDATFGLHPKLQAMHRLWEDGQLAVIHGTGFGYRGRSHFEGQDVMQTGVMKPYSSATGWLGRAMQHARVSGGLAVSIPMPLILRGNPASDTHYPNWMPRANVEIAATLEQLWSDDPQLRPFGERLLEEAGSNLPATRMTGAEYREALSPPALARAAGERMREPDGPRVGLIEFTHGFDTHALQGDDEGLHADRLSELDGIIREFHKAVGREWANSLVVTVTEFGRTVRENGSTGTDHGVATCCFIAGGLVRASRVYADWRGLDPGNWFEGRDLAPTIDTMAVYARVLQATLGLDEQVIRSRILDFNPSRHLEGLLS